MKTLFDILKSIITLPDASGRLEFASDIVHYAKDNGLNITLEMAVAIQEVGNAWLIEMKDESMNNEESMQSAIRQLTCYEHSMTGEVKSVYELTQNNISATELNYLTEVEQVGGKWIMV